MVTFCTELLQLGRSLFEVLKVQGEQLKEKRRLERGVEVVQKLWRRRKARLRLLDLMKNIVKKYIDPDSGLPYWYNPMSGAVTWEKPKVSRTNHRVISWVQRRSFCPHFSSHPLLFTLLDAWK